MVLYNINSFGGNFEYSKKIWEAILKTSKTGDIDFFVLPKNALYTNGNGVVKILITDQPAVNSGLARKIHFLYRSVVNPVIFWFFLLRRKKNFVLFNDYEQLSSFLWVPLFALIRKKIVFGFILHDPDRDNFFPCRSLSVLSMKLITWLADLLFYHEILPPKSYYQKREKNISIPHGIYYLPEPDSVYLEKLVEKKGTDLLLGILGNIRPDKNYDFALKCLSRLDNVKLLVAGKLGSNSFSTTSYHEQIENTGISSKVIWDERYLSENEFAAAISACDVILLYYGTQSVSQSGILNNIAPFQKHLLISDSPNPIRLMVEKFRVGTIVKLFDEESFINAVNDMKQSSDLSQEWKAYQHYASWENNISILNASFTKKKKWA